MKVVVIHGGNTFATQKEFLSDALKHMPAAFKEWFGPSRPRSWKRNLQDDLGDGFEVIRPAMPKAHNARYESWKNTFEALFVASKSAQEQEKLILVGHSLGGMFLVKYLAENDFTSRFSKQVVGTFLVAAPFDSENGKKIPFFGVPSDVSRFAKQSAQIYLYHSKDDPVVPFSELEKFKERLPEAKIRTFEDRQHFNQEHFPELVEDILC